MIGMHISLRFRHAVVCDVTRSFREVYVRHRPPCVSCRTGGSHVMRVRCSCDDLNATLMSLPSNSIIITLTDRALRSAQTLNAYHLIATLHSFPLNRTASVERKRARG